jgi:hypothetical protein
VKPGPAVGARAADRSMAEKADAAWGTQKPDWVAELAGFCDRTSLRVAEKRVGYSASALSAVVNRRYPGDIARVEQAVRGALMGAVVGCPVLGEIPRNDCLGWQKKPFAATSSVRAAVYRACRAGCPHSALEGGS